METVESVSIVRPPNCNYSKTQDKTINSKKNSENQEKKSKNQEKNKKLKEKTQKVGTFGIPGCRKSVQTISLH